MKNILTIAYYELKRILRNHRLVLLVLSQPIVIALIVGLIFYHEPKNIKIGLIVPNKNKYTQEIENKLQDKGKIEFIDYQAVNLEDVKLGKLRGFLTLDIKAANPVSGKIDFLNDPTGKITGAEVVSEVIDAAAEVSGQIAEDNITSELETTNNNLQKIVGGSLAINMPKLEINLQNIQPLEISNTDATPFNLKTFDYYASAIMVLMVILVVLNLASVSITSERVAGTFERLFVTPYSKTNIILGKTLAQLIIGILVAALGVGSLYLAYSVSVGNVFLILLINFLVVTVSVALGLLVSSITYAVVESVQLSMYIFFISVLTTGILAPLETANKYFAYFVQINPFYYAVDASRRVNMLDAGWHHVAFDIYILIGSALLFFILSVVLLKRQAK